MNISVTYSNHERIQYAFSSNIFENKKNHKLSTYIKYFSLFSWIDSICIFKLAFWEIVKLQIEHMYHFLFSWTDSICIFKLAFWEKLKLQIEHLYDFFVLMNWFHIFKLFSFFIKTEIANWALIWLFVVINCYNVHL